MGDPQIKWCHWKGEKQGSLQHKILEEVFKQPKESANNLWNKMVKDIIKITKEMLRESKVVDLGIKNRDGGMKVFRVKLE